jgi:hypothetical protein
MDLVDLVDLVNVGKQPIIRYHGANILNVPFYPVKV